MWNWEPESELSGNVQVSSWLDVEVIACRT